MKTFLVPMDFSAVSDELIDTAVTFARAFDGKVVLLHAVQSQIITSEYALPAEAMREAMFAAETSAAATLIKSSDLFHAAGLAVESMVRHGPPVLAILDVAKEIKADFIIMGSHGHGKLYDLLVGSTASGVIKGARCGVIILPPKEKIN